MSVYTENFHLPTLRHIYADSPDIAREANADIKHQLELRRREIDGDIGAFCVHEDLPNVEFGPLAGLPVTIKDQFHLAGTRLGFGFGQLAKNPSKKDAPALAALRKNGAHFIGRTNMPPLALDFQAVDGAGHRTNNPHDLARTAGGSSGGGAAAVAAGLSLIDIGADLSGSLRIPAHFCGVMSLVPTEGQFSNRGMLLNETAALAHFARPGIIGRSADDLWVMHQFMRGNEDVPPPLSGPSKSDVKLGWLPHGDAHPLGRDVRTVFDQWRANALRQGVQFADVDMDIFAASLRHDFAFLMGYETGGLMPWVARLAARLFGRAAARRSPDFLAQVQKGYARSKSTYKAALQRRDDYIETALSAFGNLDAIITPVTPMPAFEHVQPVQDHNGVRDYDRSFGVDRFSLGYYDALTYYTGAISLLGFPVVTLPLGFTPDGLPVGAQLIGRPNAEEALLAIASGLAL
ncbi:asparaginyl-tRNA synthase (glutamine-hydrolyzing) [Maritalea myrionectae]|uniref:Asparaginyl-tRNA synthase (Glutamine-hydrolyzing) n=1 Tax=Maritalea myrionectae TaxID=454601 RepID=A0A2R4MBD0_9HYPH|nr:amidase [Maritalea myrionectae]AVX03310.1 asparaginyl-tRNA synthase (glutamine-hydrolyzing) [Maritalea myrionectae]